MLNDRIDEEGDEHHRLLDSIENRDNHHFSNGEDQGITEEVVNIIKISIQLRRVKNLKILDIHSSLMELICTSNT
jgi:hypothetical protein